MESRPFTVWLTGLSGAGKSTIANLLAKRLNDRGVTRLEVLDGDDVRRHLSYGAGFGKEDRDAHIRRVGYVCRLLAKHGVATIVAAISPYRETRRFARALLGAFVEVFVDAPLDVLVARDPKGLYRRAKEGSLPQFTGVSDPYEPPEDADVRCQTDHEEPEESVARILAALEERGYVSSEAAGLYSPEEEAQIQTRLQSLGYL